MSASKAPRAPVHGTSFARPLTSVDVVLFTVQADALQVLLVRRPDDAAEPFPGRWALPGGFVNVEVDASLLDCALRKLREKTGAITPYLEQLGSWGSATRDPRGWSATHCFYALVPAMAVALHKGARADEVNWFDADAALRKRLAFDHAELLAAALARLRGKVEYTSLPAFSSRSPSACRRCNTSTRSCWAARWTRAPFASACSMAASWKRRACAPPRPGNWAGPP